MKKRIFVLSLMASLLAFALVSSSAMATHQRPFGASPLFVQLVPAFEPCTSANSTHGAPLNFPSCSQPVPVSNTVQIGTNAIGFAKILVCNTGSGVGQCKESAPGFTTSMQPDVRIYGAGRDVQCAVTLVANHCSGPGADYNPSTATPATTDGPYTTICTTAVTCGDGPTAKPFCAPGVGSTAACSAGSDITATAALAQTSGTVDPTAQCGTNPTCLAFAGHFVGHAIRVTDHYNCAGSGCIADPTTSNRPATMVDILFPVPVACLPTAGANGSTCGANTTANALVPGSVIANKEAVVEVGEVQQLDSGPNGTRGDSDDEIFSTQGVFLP